jgi:hypothetical protein
MVHANREHLRHSAQTKKEAASVLINSRQPHPVPAVYLSHVALECALKRRILIRSRAAHIGDLKRLLPEQDFDALFSGATGHNLHRLEQAAGLRRYLVASGNESLLAGRDWRRMGGQRPYSLRYGVETVAAQDARDQVNFAAKLADLILREAT